MNKNPEIIVILGADRVGKSTVANSIVEHYTSQGKKTSLLHFSGPQPTHNTPIDQYVIPLMEAKESGSEIIVCDRGFSEVCFYEKFRRSIEISEEWAIAAESIFYSNSSSINVHMIKRPWAWCEPHHVKEIEDLYPGCTKYFMKLKLKAREIEHYEYYKYMEDYLSNASLLPYEILNPKENEELCVVSN